MTSGFKYGSIIERIKARSEHRHLVRVYSLTRMHELVLDLGSGKGELQVFLQRARNCQCIALDITTENFKGIRDLFIRADGIALPFCDDLFDVVMSHQFMSHVRDPVRSLREQIRVLKPGGRLVMSDGNLLSPFALLNLVLMYPMRTRGQRGGFKWLRRLGRGIVYRDYDHGTPQRDEEVRSRFYWHDLFEKLDLKAIRFPFWISLVGPIYIVAHKEGGPRRTGVNGSKMKPSRNVRKYRDGDESAILKSTKTV